MKIKASIERTNHKDLQKLKRRFKSLDQAYTEIGFFDGEQHPEAEMSFASLMTILEFGSPSENIPARFPFNIIAETNHPSKDRDVKKLIRAYMSNLDKKDGSDVLLDYIGKHYHKKITNLFGNASRLEPNAPATVAKKGKNTPLVDNRDLVENLSYKTSKNGAKKK